MGQTKYWVSGTRLIAATPGVRNATTISGIANALREPFGGVAARQLRGIAAAKPGTSGIAATSPARNRECTYPDPQVLSNGTSTPATAAAAASPTATEPAAIRRHLPSTLPADRRRAEAWQQPPGSSRTLESRDSGAC